jgi:UDP-N-acetylglucosamine 2-epimerase (non-hydrolysing)
VGNTMIDTLFQNLEKIKQPSFWNESQLQSGNYFLLTLHRPSNVDDGEKLKRILDAVTNSTAGIPVVFPVHPRTRQMIDKLQIDTGKILMIDPQGYHEFIYLVKNAKGIITDSGGITEEATVLHVPCLTMRNSTERPETVTIGTNELVGDDLDKLALYLQKIIAGDWKKGEIPAYWDGQTSGRIVEILDSIYNK